MSSKQYFVLAIDCGSTNLKAAVFDKNLKRISEHIIPLKYTVNTAEKVEFDVTITYYSLVELIRKACNDADIKTDEVNAISITSQANTFSFVDRNCRPLIPYISYLDGRAVEEAMTLSSLSITKDLDSVIKSPWSTLSKLLWLKNHYPDILRYPNSLITITSYLCWRLIGINAIDDNLAAMEGLYSIDEEDWNIKILNYLEIKKVQLPRLFKVGSHIQPARLTKDISLSSKVEIVLSGNDQTATAFGNYCSKNRIIVSLGTSLVVYRYMGNIKGPYTKVGIWGVYPFGGFYELYASNFGTYSLDWAMEFLFGKRDISHFQKCVEKCELMKLRYGAEQMNKTKNKLEVFFYPLKTGSADAWVADDSASISDKAFAVLEGIGFYLKEILVEFLKIPMKKNEILVAGGGSKNKIWMQILANILNTKLIRAKGDALLGCARIALNSDVVVDDLGECYLPEKEVAKRYKVLYRKWLRLSGED